MGFLPLEYFSQHLGEYENVLSVLEDLNITILKAMDKTKKVSKTCEIFFTLYILFTWMCIQYFPYVGKVTSSYLSSSKYACL